MELKLWNKLFVFKDKLTKRTETYPYSRLLEEIRHNEITWKIIGKTEQYIMSVSCYLEIFFIRVETEEEVITNVNEVKEWLLDFEKIKSKEFEELADCLYSLWTKHLEYMAKLDTEFEEGLKKKQSIVS